MILLALTKKQEVQRRLLQMAYDSIFVLTEDKDWHETLGGRNSPDVSLILAWRFRCRRNRI